MRKILALIAIVALASCASEPANADTQTSDSTAVVDSLSVNADSTLVDSTVVSPAN